MIDNHSLPRRNCVLILLGFNWLISAITGLSFLNVLDNFPLWFGPLFLLAMLLLLSIISLYIWQAAQVRGVQPPEKKTTVSIWILLITSVICSSALHKFYPFRLAIITYWPAIPPHLVMLKYNFMLTAGCLLSVLLLFVLYVLGHRRATLLGLLILSVVMLIPNDNCGNDFNRPWLRWIGASPLMFMPNSIVVLIGYCGLCGVWPRLGTILMLLINLCVFLLGLGHLSKVIW